MEGKIGHQWINAAKTHCMRRANSAHGAVIRRLARGYEADPERRRDLLQEMHVELWRSLKSFF